MRRYGKNHMETDRENHMGNGKNCGDTPGEDTKKEERLLDAIGQIDEELVAAAVLERERKKRGFLIPWVLTAACLALVIFIGAEFFLKDGRKPDNLEELPLLTIGENMDASYGYEGYMVRDISELVNANPWNEELELKTLPVYKNPRVYDENRFVSNPDWDGMEKRLSEVISQLGMAKEEFELGDNAPDEKAEAQIREKLSDEDEEVINAYLRPTEVTAKGAGLEIRVQQDLCVWICYDPGLVLPESPSFTYEASYEELKEIAEELKEQYDGTLLQMEKPQINICGGDYTYEADRQNYRLEFFDMDGTITEQIVNYNFNKVIFYGSEEGSMDMIRMEKPDLSEKMGDYPIISVEEAKDLLLNGTYITTVPHELPGGEYIEKVELVYRNGLYDQYYMPYYRFYVELPEEKREHGLKDYGAYYVPAVERSYLSDLPVWDGSFN